MFEPGLDFLCIGALKAGTTSLHEYMRTHPELFLPEAKEQPFFTRDDAYQEGWDRFAAVAFHGAPEGRLRGLVAPECLGGPVEWRASTAREADVPAHIVTARRIAASFPDLKLIAMLRDPVERAISSYWQAVVIGDEDRRIDRALSEELSAADSERKQPAKLNQYIVVGEYGRLLAGYLELFERSQILVGSTQTLDEDPMRVMRELWRFLGVDDSHSPPNLGRRYQTRGTGARSRRFTLLPRLRRAPGLRQAWNVLPASIRDRTRARTRTAAHRYEQRHHTDDDRLDGRPSEEVLARLRDHYEDDLALLERLVGPVRGVTDAGRAALAQ